MVLSILYVATMLAFLIGAIIDCVRGRRRMRPLRRLGLVIAGWLVIGQMAILVVARRHGQASLTPLHVIAVVLGGLCAFVYVTVGTWSSIRCGVPAAPLLLGRLRRRGGEGRTLQGLLWGLAAAALAVGYSCVLFGLTQPRITELARQALDISAADAPEATRGTLLGAAALALIAFAEAIAFRLGFQNWLAVTLKRARQRYLVAIIATSAVWTAGHTLTLEPEWVKLARILPIGILFGMLFRRYGLEACIVAHAGFNVIMMYLAPLLLDFS